MPLAAQLGLDPLGVPIETALTLSRNGNAITVSHALHALLDDPPPEPLATGAALRGLEDRIRERELAEKRRVAPGWLDSDARLLEPERKFSGSAGGGAGGIGSAFEVADSDAEIEATSRRIAEMNVSPELEGVSEMPAVDEGAELDRAFGLK